MLQLFQAMFQGRQNSKTSQKTYVVSLARNPKDLLLMKDLLESGKVVPLIDACYPLSQTAEALRYFEQEHARGKVVIGVALDDKN